MIFLSIGPNYTWAQAWRHMWTRGNKADASKLQSLLTKKYDAQKALLFSQGRGALAEAVRLATGGEGKVAVTSMTCFVVIEAIRTAGCEPLYVDVDRHTLQFNADNLRRAIKSEDVRAVIVQNMLGIPVEIDEIMKVAHEHDMAVIEDLAHAVGGQYADGREIGTVGDYTMLSFGRDKMIDTINGGALVIRTTDVKNVVQPPLEEVPTIQQLRDRIYPLFACSVRGLFASGLGKCIHWFAYKTKIAVRSADDGTHPERTLPYWQAKLAHEQLKTIDKKVTMRLKNQDIYQKELTDFSVAASSNGVRWPLLVENRSEVLAKLKQAGVYAEDVWYEVPVSPARLYKTVHFPEETCPVAVQTTKHILNLPTHQLVGAEDITKICAIIKKEAKIWK